MYITLIICTYREVHILLLNYLLAYPLPTLSNLRILQSELGSVARLCWLHTRHTPREKLESSLSISVCVRVCFVDISSASVPSFLPLKSLPFYFEPISSSARRHPFPRNRRAKLDPQTRQLLIQSRGFSYPHSTCPKLLPPTTVFFARRRKSKTIAGNLLTDDKLNSFLMGKTSTCLVFTNPAPHSNRFLVDVVFTHWRSFFPLILSWKISGKSNNVCPRRSNPFCLFFTFYRPTMRVVTPGGLRLIYSREVAVVIDPKQLPSFSGSFPFQLSFVNNRTTNVWNPVSPISSRDSSFNLLLSLCKPWPYYIFIYFAFFLGFIFIYFFLLSLLCSLAIFNGRSFIWLTENGQEYGGEGDYKVIFFSRSTKLSTDRLRN